VPELSVAELAVVIVEPSSTQRRIIRGALQDAGVRSIEEADSGAAARALTIRVRPDLLISAYYLPDMTGADLINALREDDEIADTGFLLVSSETRFTMLNPVRQAGAVGILPKPFTARQLEVALNATLQLLDHSEIDLGAYEAAELRVLIVDDSQFSRQHIQRVLASMGICQFVEAEDGVKALRLINTEHFDLIVTDYNMPGMDGRELVDEIRHNSGQAGVPVLMITSEANHNRLAAVQQAGVSAICNKPFEPGHIRELVRQMLAAT
jgi:two-component system chemotaxis response regulator CheY